MAVEKSRLWSQNNFIMFDRVVFGRNFATSIILCHYVNKENRQKQHLARSGTGEIIPCIKI